MTTTLPQTEFHTDVVLEANDLVRHFDTRVNGRARTVRAVDGVSLALRRGQTLGVVGESGCGKSTTGRMLVGLDPPTSGEVLLEGERLRRPNGRVTTARRRRIQMVFQDPQASLDPRMTAAQSIAEPLRMARVGRSERNRRVAELLDVVGLDAETGGRYPTGLSGGQRQRVGIARALALDPSVIVADEPTSALDVSVRAQVVNLLKDLQVRLDIALVFISHDLSTVRYLCDEVAVMYMGKVVESGPSHQVFSSPRHPYTRALLDAVPLPDPVVEAARDAPILTGDPPDPTVATVGCPFRARCPVAFDRCEVDAPILSVDGTGHLAACHLVRTGSR